MKVHILIRGEKPPAEPLFVDDSNQCIYYIENALSAHERHGCLWQILVDDRIVWELDHWADPFFAIMYADHQNKSKKSTP